MSRSYPIWNEITSCVYESNKSYGVKADGLVVVRVGTSAKNSHQFVQHRITHRNHDNGDKEFRFFVDDKCVKRAILRKGSKELEYLDVEGC